MARRLHVTKLELKSLSLSKNDHFYLEKLASERSISQLGRI